VRALENGRLAHSLQGTTLSMPTYFHAYVRSKVKHDERIRSEVPPKEAEDGGAGYPYTGLIPSQNRTLVFRHMSVSKLATHTFRIVRYGC
jgi:hypothetical protein